MYIPLFYFKITLRDIFLFPLIFWFRPFVDDSNESEEEDDAPPNFSAGVLAFETERRQNNPQVDKQFQFEYVDQQCTFLMNKWLDEC